MEYGHVKLSRKFFALDPHWNERRTFSKAEAWIDLIQRAAWKEHKRVVDMQIIVLRRGEFLGSLRFLADAWGWGSAGKVKRFLALLEKTGRISEQRTEQSGTVYLVINYDAYQSKPTDDGTPDGTDAEQGRNSDGTPTEQREAVKAGKAGKSSPERARKRVPPHWEPTDKHRFIARERGVDFDFELAQFRDYEFAKGKSDWDATFRNWLRKAKPSTNVRHAPRLLVVND